MDWLTFVIGAALAQPVAAQQADSKTPSEMVVELTKGYCIVDTDSPSKSSSLLNLGISRADFCECIVNEIRYSFTDDTFNQRLLIAFANAMSSKSDQNSPEENTAFDNWSISYGNASRYCIKKLS